MTDPKLVNKKPTTLKRLSITVEPERYLDKDIVFRIRVDSDVDGRFEEAQIVRCNDFESIAELAFEEAVRRFKRRMGWMS